MDQITVATVVEGQGEVSALRIVLRRIGEHLGYLNVDLPTPYRMTRSRLVRPGGVETAVATVAPRVGQRGGVLVLLGAVIASVSSISSGNSVRRITRWPSYISTPRPSPGRTHTTLPDATAAATSLAGCRGLPDPFHGPVNPEGIRDAKKWLTDRMAGHPYKPTVDQAPLAARFDLELARARSASFDKFWRDTARLLGPLEPSG